jgi:hypothetical protein
MTTTTTNATRTWALAAGLAGLAADVLLVLFFAIDQPWRPGPHGTGWLGPVNDVVFAAQCAALIPVALALRRGAALGVPAMAAIVVLQLLLLTGVLPFAVQVYFVTAGIAIVMGWLLVVSTRAGLPRPAARLGTVLAATWFAGLVLVLASVPMSGGARWVLLGPGLVVGLVGFLGFGVWPLSLVKPFEEER